MKTRITVKHMKDCGALNMVKQGPWKTPWAGIEPVARYLNAWGTSKGNAVHHWWLEFRCNDPECPALILVKIDDVLEELPSGAS